MDGWVGYGTIWNDTPSGYTYDYYDYQRASRVLLASHERAMA